MRQVLGTPRTPRALFEMFAAYDARDGIESILQSVNVDDLSESEVFAAVFGERRPPGLPNPKRDPYKPRGHLRTLLQHRLFRAGLRARVADAFAEKRRVIFVHVPKCAGSDLSNHLMRRMPTLPAASFLNPDAPSEAFFQLLRNLAVGAAYSDSIAFTGHEPLSTYTESGMIRPQDWLFTTVREPVSLAYSYVNYVVGICRGAHETRRADGLAWLAELGLARIRPDIDEAGLLQLARVVLRHPNITRPDRICHMLGDGTAAGARAALIASNIEVVDTSTYAAWRMAHFPGSSETRTNASEPVLTAQTASGDDLAHIAWLTAQDRILYAQLTQCFAQAAGPSIHGRALA